MIVEGPKIEHEPFFSNFSGRLWDIPAKSRDILPKSLFSLGLRDMPSFLEDFRTQKLGFVFVFLFLASLYGLHQEPLNALFPMGCFPGDFQEGQRPLSMKSRKRPIKVGKRPIKEGKQPINASGQFSAPRHGGKRPL